MNRTAFALRADHDDFAGGQLAWGPNQQTFDVGQELNNNGGVIVVSVDPNSPQRDQEQMLLTALKDYPALKEIPISRAEQMAAENAATGPLPDGWRDFHKDRLVQLAGRRRLDSSGTKEELLSRLEKAEARTTNDNKEGDAR